MRFLCSLAATSSAVKIQRMSASAFPQNLYHNDTNLCFLGKELAAKERKLHKEKKLCFCVLGVVYGSPLWLRRKPRCVHLCPSVVKILCFLTSPCTLHLLNLPSVVGPFGCGSAALCAFLVELESVCATLIGKIMFKNQCVVFAFAALTLAGSVHAANPAMPAIPSAVFNVTNYGAIGDGVKDNTTNIQNTINAANAAGGGIVEIPAGTFLSGPITLASSINLQVDANAMLQMLPLGIYPGGTTDAQTFISCNRVHDLEISGAGKIDGQGAPWWAAHLSKTNAGLFRPMMLNLRSVNRLFIHDITFQNPPNHHCGIRGDSGNVTISNLTINTPSPSPNTDGLNFVGTNSIIENCRISVGDDNIAMGSTGPINDLLITNCSFGAGHGVSIGSGISVGISNLTVVNCTFNGTQNGIRIKCSGRSAPIKNLNYLNLTMTNVNMPIVIYSYYNVTGTPHRITPEQVMARAGTAPITTVTPRWSDITFSNLTVSSPKGDIGGIIWGPAEMPVSNVTFIHVTNNAPGTFDLYNVRGVKIIDSDFNFASGNLFTLCNAVVNISNTVPVNRVVTIGGAAGNNSLALCNATVSMNSTNLFAANPITLSGSVLSNASDLTLSGSTVQNFSIGTNSSTLVVTGNLTLNSNLNITSAGGFTATNYTLFTYTGSLSGQPTLGDAPADCTCSLDTNTPGKVMLIVSH
jgi:polygalacturonase